MGGCGRKERKERLVFCFVWLCKKGKPASCENWEHRRNLSMWLKWCLFLILTNLRGAVPNRFLLMYFLPCAFFPFSLLHRTTNSHSQVRGACVCVMVVHVCVCVCVWVMGERTACLCASVVSVVCARACVCVVFVHALFPPTKPSLFSKLNKSGFWIELTRWVPTNTLRSCTSASSAM